MSYQALARKYRPQSFSQVAGQQHALNSLMHALETQKVHHAYLFTGTRGVGKTTLGRLLAKCLNCKTGVTAEPCNKCENCIGINEGNFIDLIEIDAASRTGVEETKEILDNIQYMPSQGRYKVYLIDEVHMLSKQSFNALLKTLEEPPEYVKFILATTDYHKIPVTILSRCIQLHLKHISQPDIKNQIRGILNKENVISDEQSLDYIAYHAKGSLRDALSLLDQAISFCGGELEQSKIKQMLGIIDSEEVYAIIKAVIDENPSEVLPAVKKLALTESNADAVLDKIAEIWFSSCIYSFTESFDTANSVGVDIINDILVKISVEQVHFLYQLTISAKKDISLAPNFETGVTMAILRLIAFKKKDLNENTKTFAKPNLSDETKRNIQKLKSQELLEPKQQIQKPRQPSTNVEKSSLDNRWFDILNRLKLKGFTKTLAFNSHLITDNGDNYEIQLNDDAKKILELDSQSITKLENSLKEYLKKSNFKLSIKNFSDISKNQKSPTEIKYANAVEKVNNDKNVKLIKDELGLEIQDKNITLTD